MIGFPPIEAREESLRALGQADLFGTGVNPQQMERMRQLEVWCGTPVVLHWGKRLWVLVCWCCGGSGKSVFCFAVACGGVKVWCARIVTVYLTRLVSIVLCFRAVVVVIVDVDVGVGLVLIDNRAPWWSVLDVNDRG